MIIRVLQYKLLEKFLKYLLMPTLRSGLSLSFEAVVATEDLRVTYQKVSPLALHFDNP